MDCNCCTSVNQFPGLLSRNVILWLCIKKERDMTIKSNKVVNQMIELKKPVDVTYEGQFFDQEVSAVKVMVLRSGKPSYIVDKDGERYEFEYITEKELIYRTVIRNLMFKELIWIKQYFKSID